MTPETALKHQIKAYLDLKGIYHFPIVASAISPRGLPDRVAVKDGHYYAIEVKAPKGRMSPAQLEHRDRTLAAGGTYVEARSLEDVMKHFEKQKPIRLEPDQTVRFPAA